MKTNKKLYLVLGITAIQIIIALQNMVPIEINVLFWKFHLPLVLVVMIPLFIGVLIGILFINKKKEN